MESHAAAIHRKRRGPASQSLRFSAGTEEGANRNGSNTNNRHRENDADDKTKGAKTSLPTLFVKVMVVTIVSFLVLLTLSSSHQVTPQISKENPKTALSAANAQRFDNGRRRRNDLPIEQENRKGKTPKQQEIQRKVVTVFMEPPTTLQSEVQPLPRRSTSRDMLGRIEFPEIGSCTDLVQDFGNSIVNTFSNFTTDPFLPWIHDFFVHNAQVVFVGQNRRNCETGKGMEQVMHFWSPQIALFQPVPVVRTDYIDGTSSFHLFGGSDPQQPTLQSSSDSSILHEEVIPETRFLCRFHWNRQDDDSDGKDETFAVTLSRFPFNYEYVSWRKRALMFDDSLARSPFWVSQLIFSCPIPAEFQTSIATQEGSLAQVLVDVIPIRTPPRSREVWMTPQMVGQELFKQFQHEPNFYDVEKQFGTDHILPAIVDSGRWANLPVCRQEPKGGARKKPYRLIACTWTSASYHRRGEDDGQPLNDNTLRLREWILFHRLVGFDHGKLDFKCIFCSLPSINFLLMTIKLSCKFVCLDLLS
jgi:hypothetical protein